MNLSGCDKVVLKNSINGSRFIVSEEDNFFSRASHSENASDDVTPTCFSFSESE